MSTTNKEFNNCNNIKRIYIGCDHGGFEYKEELKNYIQNELCLEVIDLGCYSKESVDYPDYGFSVSEHVIKDNESRGVVVCTSGIGISIAANKIKGARCGLCYDDVVSCKIVEHNNCNVCAFGQNYMLLEDCKRRLKIFLESKFEGGRHQRRVDKLDTHF